MNFIVLNGSLKGEYSITLQYVHVSQEKLPQYEPKVIHISKNIKKIEADEKTLQSIIITGL
jgi:aspartate 1-decarboxylase